MRTSRLASMASVALLGLGSAVSFGCGSSGSSGPGVTTNPALTVTLRNVAFNPSKLNVKVGDTVTFIWQDGPSLPHNIDGASDLASFSSGTPKTSGAWSYQFTKAGSYQYHCDVHPNMQGTVTVS